MPGRDLAAAVTRTPIPKALKALFVLLPLLGLTNVLFFVNPKDGGIGDHIFQVFNAVIQSSQGIFVSLIYCFTNAEPCSRNGPLYFSFRDVTSETRRVVYASDNLCRPPSLLSVQAVIRDKLAVIKMKQSVYNNGGATTKKNDYTVTSQGGTRV
ncbi:hypothetical protein Bbelb_199770 [Branchiostoma belcheri]|nr:hypothetical protein Bbelb_199770 [Branchiostoma belcheri]